MSRIIITGASSGIGEATAKILANKSNTLYLTGRNQQRLNNVAKELYSISNSNGIFTGTGNVSNDQDVKRLYLDAVKKMGGVDALVANAGVGHFSLLEDMTTIQFDEQFNTNVRGVFLWIKIVLPLMKKENRGQIVVVSSTGGLRGIPNASIYCATKFAIQGMVASLREELNLISTNIKVGTVNPGSVDTPWFDGKDVDRSKMLSAEDIAVSIKSLIEQSLTSNIALIHLIPANK